MSNLGRAFLDLLPAQPLLVAQVTAHNSDGTSTVEFPNGSTLVVRGQSVAVGSYAFIRDGEIRSEAPAVTPDTLEV